MIASLTVIQVTYFLRSKLPEVNIDVSIDFVLL